MKRTVLFISLGIVNLAMLAVATFRFLPERIPVHIDLRGVPDAWGPRWVTLLFGLIPFVILAIITAYQRYTRDHADARRNQRAEQPVLVAMMVFFLLLSWLPVVLGAMSGREGGVQVLPLLICLLLGALLIVVGNFLPVAKQSRRFGIRTRWTLGDEEVWRRTHRMAAYLMVFAGLAVILSALAGFFLNLPWLAFIGLAAVILLVAVAPTCYSAWVYKKRRLKGV